MMSSPHNFSLPFFRRSDSGKDSTVFALLCYLTAAISLLELSLSTTKFYISKKYMTHKMYKFNRPVASAILILIPAILLVLAEAQRPIILKMVTSAPNNARPGSVAAGGAAGAKNAAPAAPSTVSGNLTFVVTGSMLPSARKGAKPDSFVKVFTFVGGTDGKPTAETELGTTETVKSNENPQFNKVFWILWKKGTGQKLRITAKDHHTIGRDDDLGEVAVDLDQYVLEKNQKFQIPLRHDPKSKLQGGQLLVEKTTPTSFRLYARNVPHKDPLNGKSDPYCEIFWRRGKNGTDIPIGVTEVKDDEENPDWNQTFEFTNYQKGTDQYWFFKVQDKDSLSSDLVGELLVEVDPFVTRRQTKITKLERSDGKCTLAITPA